MWHSSLFCPVDVQVVTDVTEATVFSQIKTELFQDKGDFRVQYELHGN